MNAIPATGKSLPTCNPAGPCKHVKPTLTLTIPANAMALSMAQMAWDDDFVDLGFWATIKKVLLDSFERCKGGPRATVKDIWAYCKVGFFSEGSLFWYIAWVICWATSVVRRAASLLRGRVTPLSPPMSPASSPEDHHPQQSSLDDMLQAMVLQEAREAWAEEARLKWDGAITQPLPSVFGQGDEEEEEMWMEETDYEQHDQVRRPALVVDPDEDPDNYILGGF